MLRTLAARHARRRKGAVLIVVLAMLVLFAVLGLSFVLYSEAQLSAAQNKKDAENLESPPNALHASEWWMGTFLFDVSDGQTNPDDLLNPIRGHSLGRSKYSFPGSLLPYGALPMQAEPVGFNWNNITDSRRIVRHTWDVPSNSVFDPERFYNAVLQRNSPTGALVGTYQGKNYPFTYADRHDFYLAQMDPTTGQITVPSFHRDDLFGPLNPTGSATPNPNWTSVEGKFLTLRPRPQENPNFPAVPVNPDGTYTGDVANMKFINGSQRNDSLWMYAGGPMLRWRGKTYTAFVAPLVLDLNSRVNLSTVGDLKNLPNNAAAPHGSNQGWGPWEVNPMQLGMTSADLQLLIQRRYGKTAADFNPPVDPYTLATSSARLNHGKMPAQYAPLDADAIGPTVAANDGALILPPIAPGGFNPFPIYNNPLALTAPFRYEPNPVALTAALTNHPSQYNPLLYPRTPGVPATQPGGFGLDDLVKLYARYSDPKNRHLTATSVPGGTSLTPSPDTAVARQLRALTTTFSTTQRWAGVDVQGTVSSDTTLAAVQLRRLGPIDLNRPLPDFRRNTALPHAPLNNWDPTTEQANYYAALSARQRLARDIFVRLAGRYGLIDGVAAVYLYDTGVVRVRLPMTDARVQSLAVFAQVAVNMVDYIDDDDMVTPFVWRPTDDSLVNSAQDPALDLTATGNNFVATNESATRVAYGTELPRLVLNEVYSGAFNDRRDPAIPLPMPHAMHPLKRRYWIELHNPTPSEPTLLPRSDQGAARLQYQTTTTQVYDPTNATPTLMAYTGPTFNPYRIEIATVNASATPAIPYTTALATGNGAVASDTATLFAATGATATLQVRINTYTHTTATPPGPATLAATPDELNVVRPATATTGANGGNVGYYVIGPQDQFPAGGVTNTLSLNDPAPGIPSPAAPVNALSFDVTAGAPSETNITDEIARSSVVILRRTLDPYRLAQEDPLLPNFNPYITVDYLENLPARDKAEYNDNAGHTPTTTNQPSVGRTHPYAAAPTYGTAAVAPAFNAVQDQVNPAITTPPPHTFFGVNNPADNSRPTATPTFGFEWLVHLDRELVSLPELAHASQVNPARLTQSFFNGTAYHGHIVGLTPTTRWLTDTAGLFETATRLPGAPLGGREPGRINVNTMDSVSVLSAVLDPQPGNGFTATNPTFVTNAWGQSFVTAAPLGTRIARTQNGVPRMTIYEAATPTGTEDRPFVWGSGNWSLASTDGLLSRRTTTTATDPLVFGNSAASGGHPYLVAEPMRKAWNHLTPVSDTFLVLMTVGFFEVTATNPAMPISVTNQPIFGAELFDKVPGDLRVQFAGVIDRSQLAIADPANPTVPAPEAPFQTKLTTDIATNSTAFGIEAAFVATGGVLPDGTTATVDTAVLYGDGQRRFVTIPNGTATRLRVGYGDKDTNTGDGEWLTVNAVAQRVIPTGAGNVPVPGEVALTLAAVPTRFHGAGSLVSNAVYGNPGPQPGVRLPDLQRRGLVPYFTRLEP